ncbi:MAG: ABC transporter permease [Ignavibacteria bacterium]|nr:ABC transporter permease [Ignavibacteria bacterium]
MVVLKLIIKNSFRHTLRTALTVVGLAIAVLAFGLMRTIVDAWYAGVEMSSANRMITRHSVSFIFSLPLSYKDQIAKIPGVTGVSYANWFGGLYGDPNQWENFFPRMAIDPETYFDMYPEFIVPPDQLETFRRERNACVIGKKLADEHRFRIGDAISMEGDIYPGSWTFVVRGIYTGRDKSIDETQMLFHWAYLDESIRAVQPGRAGNIGWYVLEVDDPNRMAGVAEQVDALFMNSRAGTKTETEKEFQQSFVSMSSAIITSLEVISFVIIGIILLVLANTIVMSARERMREYAVLKTIGFSSARIVSLIGGESLLIAAIGTAFGIAGTFPICQMFAEAFPTFFPIFNVAPLTLILCVLIAFGSAALAALFPAVRASRMKIVDGLRAIG